MIKSPEYYLVFKDLLFFSIETERSNAKSFSKSKLTFAHFFLQRKEIVISSLVFLQFVSFINFPI